MQTQAFTLNNQFLVDPARNILNDLENAKETRLEPRLMHLLCLLAERPGTLVSRELIITKIWNDYGGADDALNQAIFFLRKALLDIEKNIIETIPKKGYILHAKVVMNESLPDVKKRKPTSLKSYVLIVSAILILGTFIVFLVPTKTRNNKGEKNDVSEIMQKSTEVRFADLIVSEKETYFNTITTTGLDSTKYRLFAVGDQMPKFYINNIFVPESKRDKYAVLIDGMLHQLWERQNKANDSLSSGN